MTLGASIFLRRESLRRLLWEKLESWRWSRPDNALGRAFACYDFEGDLEESLDAVGIDKDFEPTFTFLESKSKAIDQLKRAAKSADEVYLAADDDREGEAIAYSVALLLKLPLRTTPRIVFHEITEAAVKAALANPRRLDMQRIEAQQARAMLDMMIGFTHKGRKLGEFEDDFKE
jgi:DNA topoisomerase IA